MTQFTFLKPTYLVYVASLAVLGCSDADITPVKTEVISQDWCFSGGTIYAATPQSETLTALAVKDGVITYTHSETPDADWCQTYAGDAARSVDLTGHALYPGLTDSHAHLIGIGLRELTFNLEGTRSVNELKSRLARVVADTPEGETIYGRGWIETHWPEKRFPTRFDLDEVAPNHPVILSRADGHAVVINTTAVNAASLTPDTPAPFGGAINTLDTGELSGILVDNAIGLIQNLMPKMTPARKREAYIKGAEVYAQRGWTNIHSMSVDPDDVPLINELANNGDIKIRVYNSIDLLEGRDLPSESADAKDNPLVTTRAIKLYADGALGSHGAALLEPYSDEPGNVGLITLKHDTVIPTLHAALRSGTQVNIHAIGDKANRQVLEWYQEAFNDVPEAERAISNPRWRIEHSQILDTDDIQAFARLGVIASMQPSHAIGDLHFAVDRLGKARLKGGYAWKSLIESGAVLIGGSDAPVEVGDPRIELYAAIHRQDLNGYSDDAWYPEEKLSPDNALKMFTAWPAFASFQETELGTLEIGKVADFTVFSRDILTSAPKDMLDATVLMTIVDGKVAYEAP